MSALTSARKSAKADHTGVGEVPRSEVREGDSALRRRRPPPIEASCVPGVEVRGAASKAGSPPMLLSHGGTAGSPGGPPIESHLRLARRHSINAVRALATWRGILEPNGYNESLSCSALP